MSLSVVLWLLAALSPAHAKKGPLDKVRDLCPGLAIAQRPSLVVQAATAPVPVPDAVRQSTASMLGSALLGSGCFAVVDPATPEAARYRITGRVFEFSETAREASIVVNGEPMTAFRARMGVVLELTDATSGEVLASQTFSADDKSRELARTDRVGPSRALTSVTEQIVADAVAFFAPYRARLTAGE